MPPAVVSDNAPADLPAGITLRPHLDGRIRVLRRGLFVGTIWEVEDGWLAEVFVDGDAGLDEVDLGDHEGHRFPDRRTAVAVLLACRGEG